MSEAIKTKTIAVQNLFTELQVVVGQGEYALSKNIIEEPALSATADALNDIEALIVANFSKTEGSLLGFLEDKMQIIRDGVS